MANESISNLPSLPSAVISTDLFLLSRANPPLVGGYTTYNASAAQLSAGLTLTPTITGGSINGTVIGNVSPAAGTFSTLTVTGAANFPGGLTLASINNTPIGNVTPSTGAFTTLSASSLSVVAINSTPIGPTIPSTGSFTTLAASGAVSGAGFTALFASPPTIGGTAPAAVAATTLSATGQFTSTVAIGTPPLVVTSTTNVPNLNASSLSGATFASPGPIGSSAASTSVFTKISGKGNGSVPASIGGVPWLFSNNTSTAAPNVGGQFSIYNPDGQGGGLNGVGFGNGAGSTFQLSLYSSDGTMAAPTNLKSSAPLGQYVFGGYDGAAWSGAQATINGFAAENWAVGSHGTSFQFDVTPTGTTSQIIIAQFDGALKAVSLGGAGGSESLRVPSVTSAVNRVQISGGITGNPAIIAAAGTDTNVSINITPQAAGTTSITAGGLAVTGGVSATASFTSTVAIGTPPLVVTSTTNVPNLNASSLSGATFASPGPIGSSAASTGAFTTLSASSTVSGTGFSTYLASPPAIGGTTPAAGSFTALNSSGGLNVTANGAVIVGTVSLGGVAGAESLLAPAVASAVNRLSVSGSVTTQPVVVAALGTDANINLKINSKGTGLVQFGTASSFAANATTATLLGSLGPTGSHTTVQTWLTFFDSGGIQRWVPCF